MAVCCIMLLVLLVGKNLWTGHYVLAAAILLLAFLLITDVLAEVLHRPVPVPVPVILASICSTILLTIHYLGPYGAVWAFPAIVGANLVEARHDGIFMAGLLTIAVPAMVLQQGEIAMAARLLVALSITSVYMWYSIRKFQGLQARLLADSLRDPLTGSYNRRYLDWAASQARVGETAVMVIDIDHFKQVNDNFGHAVGDSVLIDVCRIIQDTAGSDGMLFRIGGEEFVLLLPHWDQRANLLLAETLRRRIETAPAVAGADVTVSIGLVVQRNGEELQQTLERADAQLYLAKHNGRNRVQYD